MHHRAREKGSSSEIHVSEQQISYVCLLSKLDGTWALVPVLKPSVKVLMLSQEVLTEGLSSVQSFSLSRLLAVQEFQWIFYYLYLPE